MDARWPRHLLEFTGAGLRTNAFELYCAYYAVADEYDRAICTGPVQDDVILPANSDEAAASNRYARELHRAVEAIARDMGISDEDLILGSMEADDLRQAHCRVYGERSGWTKVLRQRMHAKAVRASQERARVRRNAAFA
jgi:hypothetical protein